MIFRAGWHHGQYAVLATPFATLRPNQQGQVLHQHAMGDTPFACFGQIPWIGRQGVRHARWQQSNDVSNKGDDSDSNGSNTDNKDVKWMAMVAVTTTTTTTTTITSMMTTTTMGWQQCNGNNNVMVMDSEDGDNDEGEVDNSGSGGNDKDDCNGDVDNDDNEWWRQQQWDDNIVMVMGSQKRAKFLRALCHPFEETINICRKFGEESRRERYDFGGWEKKGSRWKRLGGDHFISTQSIPTHLPHTTEWKTHGILFRMCPRSKAALLAPWWACLDNEKEDC
jgi:hypothetical protein